MEILFSFLGGLILTSIVGIIIAKRIINSRISQTMESARIQAESYYKVENARLETDIKYAKERIEELQALLESAKNETVTAVKNAKESAEHE